MAEIITPKKDKGVVKITITTDRYWTQDAFNKLTRFWDGVVVDELCCTLNVQDEHFKARIDVDNSNLSK